MRAGDTVVVPLDVDQPLVRWSAITQIVYNLAIAAATLETIGAEKCGGRVTAFEVEFFAPEGAALEATAKALVRGTPSLAPRSRDETAQV